MMDDRNRDHDREGASHGTGGADWWGASRADRSGDSGRSGGYAAADAEELRRLAKALQSAPPGMDIVAIIGSAILLAIIIWVFMFGWALLIIVPCVIGFALLFWRTRRRRPPVAPLELTAAERARVRRVLDEHGVRPAISLVRALYPGESTAAAVKTVRLIADRG